MVLASLGSLCQRILLRKHKHMFINKINRLFKVL